MDRSSAEGRVNPGYDSAYGPNMCDVTGTNNNNPDKGKSSRKSDVTKKERNVDRTTSFRDTTQPDEIAGCNDATGGIRNNTPRGTQDGISWIPMNDEIVTAPEPTMSMKDTTNVLDDFISWQKKMEKEYQETQSTWFRIWNDRCVLIASYFIGVVLFVVFFHISSLPKLPFPVLKNLADWDPDVVPYIWWPEGPVLVEIMWGYTHIRRTLFIIISSSRISTGSTHIQTHDLLRQHDQAKSRSLQRCLGACAVIHHVIFGVWLGWANNVFCGYMASDREFLLAGIALFSVGELTITIGEAHFLCGRVTETRMFRNVRLAAELLIWAGFALVSMSLPSILLFVARFGMLAFFVYLPERPSCVCSSR